MNSITKLQPDWWVRVPEAERRFLRVLMGTIHEVEAQGPPELAGFAREWERSLGCFIKTRLKNRRGEGRRRRVELRCQSTSPLIPLPKAERESGAGRKEAA